MSSMLWMERWRMPPPATVWDSPSAGSTARRRQAGAGDGGAGGKPAPLACVSVDLSHHPSELALDGQPSVQQFTRM